MATNKPSANRVAAHRARLREQGLRPIEVWAQPQHHQAIRDFAANVQRQSELAIRPDAPGAPQEIPG
jgi:hypothetical protein